MNGRRRGTTLAACLAGVANQAVITNVTALLFVPFSRLYGFSLAQLGVLTAVNFAAQMCADIFLLFFIDRLSYKGMALFAAALSAGGLLFYGADLPCLSAFYIPLMHGRRRRWRSCSSGSSLSAERNIGISPSWRLRRCPCLPLFCFFVPISVRPRTVKRGERGDRIVCLPPFFCWLSRPFFSATVLK